MAREEQILAVVEGDNPGERLVLALDPTHHEKPLILRSESFSTDVGWFSQSSMRFSRSELNGLRSVLGIPQAPACSHSSRAISDYQSDTDAPRILSMASFRRA
ncbi:hypothetical protein SH449x_000295 [Pirellulaceae bacterium SH449]